jgi:prepilin-type N-terminal cleavage/methylation domain-containing protein
MAMKPLRQTPFSINNRGFSLVELMIAVAVIAILAAIAIPMYQNYITTSKQSSARTIMEQFPILLETYRAENGRMSPDCNGTVNCAHTYNYSENDSGVEDTAGAAADRISRWYPDFRAKSSTSGASLYDYSVTVTVSGCPAACVESAQVTATPVVSRGAPAGNIVGSAF